MGLYLTGAFYYPLPIRADLIIISNHYLNYTDFDFDRLGREIAAQLNQTRLRNPEFYWLSRLYWGNTAGHPAHQGAYPLLVPWTFNDEEYHRAGFYDREGWMWGLLSFSGPFGREINIRPGNAEISLLPFRYLGWVGPDENDPDRPLRTAYRKALATLVRSLGGSEATYLADNGHSLERFAELQNYAVMRQELEQQMGPPLSSFAQMENWQLQRKDATTGRYLEDRTYLVDNFRDLDWSRPIGLPPYLQELRDKSGLPPPNPA